MSNLGFNKKDFNVNKGSNVKQAKTSKPNHVFKLNNQNYNNEPKAENSNKSNSISKDHKINFGPKPKKKPIQYGNMRVNQSIVDRLKVWQFAFGFRSRSALLKSMCDYCEPLLKKAPSNIKNRAETEKKSIIAKRKA